MRNVVFKPNGSGRSGPKSGVRAALSQLAYFVLALPLAFSIALLIGGDMLLAVLTVLVVGAMGYLVLSVFS